MPCPTNVSRASLGRSGQAGQCCGITEDAHWRRNFNRILLHRPRGRQQGSRMPRGRRLVALRTRRKRRRGRLRAGGRPAGSVMDVSWTCHGRVVGMPGGTTRPSCSSLTRKDGSETCQRGRVSWTCRGRVMDYVKDGSETSACCSRTGLEKE